MINSLSELISSNYFHSPSTRPKSGRPKSGIPNTTKKALWICAWLMVDAYNRKKNGHVISWTVSIVCIFCVR